MGRSATRPLPGFPEFFAFQAFLRSGPCQDRDTATAASVVGSPACPFRPPRRCFRFTRAVFILGVCLTAGTGFALYVFPDRTADYWAWTITAEPSAASFGAGYLGAGVALTLGALTREWRQARVVVVLVFALTSLALVVTMVNFEPFAIGEGGLTEAVAWTWLVVYIALPPLALAAFVLQERAGGAANTTSRSRCGDRRSCCWEAPRPSSAWSAWPSWSTGAGSPRVGRGR